MFSFLETWADVFTALYISQMGTDVKQGRSLLVAGRRAPLRRQAVRHLTALFNESIHAAVILP